MIMDGQRELALEILALERVLPSIMVNYSPQAEQIRQGLEQWWVRSSRRR